MKKSQIHFKKRNWQGFTLFEILVALFIFAILGMITAMAFHSMLKVHSAVKRRDQQLQQIEIAMTRMQQDFSNIIDRSITNEDGHRLPAVYSDKINQIAFTRAGVINPWNVEKRGNMQRVGYMLINHHWIRLTWNVLDRPPNNKPLQKVLLSNVNKVKIEFVDASGQKYSMWPVTKNISIHSNQQTSRLPKAIQIILWFSKLGKIQMTYPIRGGGFAQTVRK